MICAGFILDEHECVIELGSPLLYEGRVVGIASGSKNCYEPDDLNIYTSVANFINWINDTIKESEQTSSSFSNQVEQTCGSFSNKVGAITLLTPLLYLILSV